MDIDDVDGKKGKFLNSSTPYVAYNSSDIQYFEINILYCVVNHISIIISVVDHHLITYVL